MSDVELERAADAHAFATSQGYADEEEYMEVLIQESLDRLQEM